MKIHQFSSLQHIIFNIQKVASNFLVPAIDLEIFSDVSNLTSVEKSCHTWGPFGKLIKRMIQILLLSIFIIM